MQDATNLLRLAWSEAPGLAIHLSTRFPSLKLKNDIRWLVLNFPDKAIDEPSALEVIFGSALPADVHSQLKVCQSSFIYSRFWTDEGSFFYTGPLSTPPKL